MRSSEAGGFRDGEASELQELDVNGVEHLLGLAGRCFRWHVWFLAIDQRLTKRS